VVFVITRRPSRHLQVVTLSRILFVTAVVGPLGVIPFTLVGRGSSEVASGRGVDALASPVEWSASQASPSVFDVSLLPRVDADTVDVPPKRNRAGTRGRR
jgi:hypothetical protein